MSDRHRVGREPQQLPVSWNVIRDSFARSDDPYRGADVSASVRSVAMLGLLGAVLTLAFLPMKPPTEAIGSAGWVVAAVLVVACLATVRWIVDPRKPTTFNQLLAVTYAGIASVALLEWLAGGHSPYMLLYLLWIGAGTGVHPPRRAVPVVAAALVAGALPLAYAGWDSGRATDIAATSLLWVAIGTVLIFLIATVRTQRATLRSGERSARAEAEQAAKRVRDVQQVTDVGLGQLPLDAFLQELLERISRVLDLDAAAILLTDEHGDSLELRAAAGIEPRRGGPIRFPMGHGCAGRVASEARTIHVDNIRDTGDLDPVFADSDVSALLGVPLKVDSRVIGVLEVGTMHSRRFSGDDVRLLELAADRLSQVIERTRLNERAHHIAETLQRALLPDRLPEVPGISLAARYLPGGPGTEVGGDWYDVIPHVDGRLTLVMGDVVGRGIAAASLMGQLRSALRVYALEDESPSRILERMNLLVDNLAPGQMATAVAAIFDPDTSRLCFAAAGHPPPVLLAPDGSAKLLESPPAVPLGVLPYGRYHQHETQIEPASTLLLYTDGLVERRDSPLGEGLRRLREVVEGGPSDPEALCDHVLSGLLPEGPTGDDVATLALCATPVAAERLHLDVHADPDELAVVRHSLARWLAAAEVHERDAYRVTLACNEACMNAIEHAYSPGDALFEIDALIADDGVDITVRDHGHWREPREDLGGRGLDMMRSLMDDVEVDPTPEGTTVHMRRSVRRQAVR